MKTKYFFETSCNNKFILECLIDRINKNGYEIYHEYEIIYYKRCYILQAFLYINTKKEIDDLIILLSQGIHKNHPLEFDYSEL